MDTVRGTLSNGVYTSESGLVYYVGGGKEYLLNIIATVAILVEGDVSFEKAIATIETEMRCTEKHKERQSWWDSVEESGEIVFVVG
jgi:hypothetical protein